MPFRFTLYSAFTFGLTTLSIGVAADRASALLLNDGGTHVIADGTYTGETIFVRNVGCGTVENPRASCASPGNPTSATLVTNGAVGSLESHDTSTIAMTGGEVGTFVDSYGSSIPTGLPNQRCGEAHFKPSSSPTTPRPSTS